MVGAYTDSFLSALGLNSQGGGGETGGVSGIRISSSSVLTPDDEGVVNMTGYIIQPAEKTRWDAAAAMRHAHSNKSILDSITSQQISSWNALTAVRILPGDGLAGGGDLSADVTLSVKLASNSGLSVSSGGLKLDAVNALNSTLTYKALSAAQGKALNDRLAILEAMFTREGSGTSADPYVIRANYGLYTDSFLSALGLNSQGGGGSTFDEDQMWAALRSNTGTYANEKINANHIPDMAGIYGYLKTHQTLYTLSIYGGTTKVLDFKPDANASIYIKAGGDISLANDTTNRYITLSYSHPTDGANTTISAANGRVLSAITVNSLGHVTSVSSKTLAAADIPSLAWDKITSGKPTTLGGYGITDAKIQNGTITLGSNSITPLTSFTETDPTVPAWAKASTKPSYSFSEITGTIASSQLPTLYWANVEVSSSSSDTTEPKMKSLHLYGTSQFGVGGKLKFGDGDYVYLAEEADDKLTIKGNKGIFLMPGSSYYVGIGTDSPSHKLDVAGDINATLDITTAQAVNARNIELSFTSPFIDLHHASSSADYTSRLITTDYGTLNLQSKTSGGTDKLSGFVVGANYDGSFIQIGNIKIVYDSANNALKIIKSDGTSANLYATGGVAALGTT